MAPTSGGQYHVRTTSLAKSLEQSLADINVPIVGQRVRTALIAKASQLRRRLVLLPWLDRWCAFMLRTASRHGPDSKLSWGKQIFAVLNTSRWSSSSTLKRT